jgi:hypothetical protein
MIDFLSFLKPVIVVLETGDVKAFNRTANRGSKRISGPTGQVLAGRRRSRMRLPRNRSAEIFFLYFTFARKF